MRARHKALSLTKSTNVYFKPLALHYLLAFKSQSSFLSYVLGFDGFSGEFSYFYFSEIGF